MIQVLGDGTGFKLRAAAVVIRDGRVLLHRSLAKDLWWLPGGTVEFGETAEVTLRRELAEELGVDAEIERLLWVVEHFFDAGRRWHQVAWLYETRLPEGCDALLRDEWEAEEPEGRVLFRWVPLGEVASLRHIPGLLATSLAELPPEPVHVVCRDIE